MTKIPHPTSPCGLPPNGFHAPVIFAGTGGGETAGSTAALLEVEAPAAAADAERVGLVPALTEAPCALTHFVTLVGGYDGSESLNKLAAQARVLIVSVEYRLAPENPLPVPYEDSWAAFQWAVRGSDEWVSLYGDTSRVFLAGESAGANIAHDIAMRVGDNGFGSRATKEVDGLVLVHPLFWGSERMGAETDPNPDNVLKPEQLDAGWQLVCGPQEEADLDDPRLNPFAERAPPLSGLGCKRVLVCVAGTDLLRERGRAYWAELGKCGWKGTAEIMESEGEDHGFYFERPESEKAVELLGRVVGFFDGQ